ncbi:hypothetical protein LUZ60_006136 [Juncus effusus]|nr:hypothetical protein LUZ60_006136 [Juncus effusus]
MAGQGSGSAILMKLSLLLSLLCIFSLSGTAESAVYTVGDNGGWSFNTGGWPSGKNFRAGDVLIFNYNPAIHNVVAVDSGGYNSCRTPAGARAYNSGSDRVMLHQGSNYFICNFAGHCEGGMKIVINAH